MFYGSTLCVNMSSRATRSHWTKSSKTGRNQLVTHKEFCISAEGDFRKWHRVEGSDVVKEERGLDAICSPLCVRGSQSPEVCIDFSLHYLLYQSRHALADGWGSSLHPSCQTTPSSVLDFLLTYDMYMRPIQSQCSEVKKSAKKNIILCITKLTCLIELKKTWIIISWDTSSVLFYSF